MGSWAFVGKPTIDRIAKLNYRVEEVALLFQSQQQPSYSTHLDSYKAVSKDSTVLVEESVPIGVENNSLIRQGSLTRYYLILSSWLSHLALNSLAIEL